MDETERSVHRLLTEGERKYTYFLLAAAGAALALGAEQTRAGGMSWSQLPLGVAALLWAASFFSGCRHLQCGLWTLGANAAWFRIGRGEQREVGDDPERIKAAMNTVAQAMEDSGIQAKRFCIWQFRLLVAGGVAYLAWHVLEMCLRTASPSFVR